jgi:ArsR family transcriptional regulator, arsenate/arsenite/antimonite-responsive transcriptional repressor
MLRNVPGSTEIELIAARFRALGDPTRLCVVQELARGTRCVCELREQSGVSGPLLSHHLSVLRDAGLITAIRRGRWVDYSLDTDVLTRTLAAATADLAGVVR